MEDTSPLKYTAPPCSSQYIKIIIFQYFTIIYWIEQGGRIVSGGNQTISLLKPYRDTSFSVMTQESYKGGVNWNGNPITVAFSLLTNTSFFVATYGDYNNITAYWYAFGYAA